MVWFSDWHFYL
jgi:hypothetical protein